MALQLLEIIGQLLEIIGSDETTSREQSRSTHSVTGDSTVGSSRPRSRQGQQHEASGPGRCYMITIGVIC